MKRAWLAFSCGVFSLLFLGPPGGPPPLHQDLQGPQRPQGPLSGQQPHSLDMLQVCLGARAGAAQSVLMVGRPLVQWSLVQGMLVWGSRVCLASAGVCLVSSSFHELPFLHTGP